MRGMSRYESREGTAEREREKLASGAADLWRTQSRARLRATLIDISLTARRLSFSPTLHL
jgi:hypothetical protein